MIPPVSTRKPSPSDFLESSHGHLNGETPQRNSFHMSLDRIVLMPKEKMAMFQNAMRHNFCRSIRQSVNRTKTVPAQQMEQDPRFNGAGLVSCSCGGTAHLAQTNFAKSLWSHQYSLGGFQPICPTLELQQDASQDLADHGGTHAQRSSGNRCRVHGKCENSRCLPGKDAPASSGPPAVHCTLFPQPACEQRPMQFERFWKSGSLAPSALFPSRLIAEMDGMQTRAIGFSFVSMNTDMITGRAIAERTLSR